MNTINMKFSLWDRAFVVKDDAVFSCEIIRVMFEEEEDKVDKSFRVERTIPRGLFDEDVRREIYKEDELFLDKKEAKEFLSNLKEARKVVDKYGLNKNCDDFYNNYNLLIGKSRGNF